MLRDCRDLEISAPSRAALDGYEEAVELMLGLFADPFAAIEAALAEHPDFPAAHAFRANLLVTSSVAGTVPEIRRSVAAVAESARATDRDRAHASAAAAWADGQFDLASARYDAIARTWPRDLSAIQFAQQVDFFTGDRHGLLDGPARALADWKGAHLPGEGFLHGMLAFGQEEHARYARAEESGRRAVEMNPRDAWAIHAVAHVMEMQGRDREGVRWLGERSADWALGNMLAYHNWWHLALYHLERNETQAALDLYDRAIRVPGTDIALEMVDASAMLWRLALRGVDVGHRWHELADQWAVHPAGFYAFNDVHAVMAFVGAQQPGRVAAWIEALGTAARGRGTNAAASAQVGLPMARAIAAFGSGDWRSATGLLAPLPEVARRMGGSNAQRDIVELTLLEAALRAGDRRLAGRLALRRTDAKPESPFARMLAQRAAGLPVAA
jgi:tetratricopeptide (TPR) repeat protein